MSKYRINNSDDINIYDLISITPAEKKNETRFII